MAGTLFGGIGSASAEICPGADRLVVVLIGELTREDHPWADRANVPEEAPLDQVTLGGPVGTVWVRPAPLTPLEELAGWMLQQPGVADVQCPRPEDDTGAELLPFPPVLVREDPEPTPGRGRPGAVGSDGSPPQTAPDPAPDPDVQAGGAEQLPTTGPHDRLLANAAALVAAGMVLVWPPRRRQVVLGRQDSQRV